MAKRRCETFNNEIGNIKENQSKMKKTITKMNNTLEGINSKLDKIED